MNTSAGIVEKNFKYMGTGTVNTVAAAAISGTDLGAAMMSKEEFRNEKLYHATMGIAKKMLAEGIISEMEYRQINTIFLEKYHPVLGTLFSESACYLGQKE